VLEMSRGEPSVNFINILQAAFMGKDLKIAKRHSGCQSFLALCGSLQAKAAHRTLMKLTPERVTLVRIET